MYLKRIRIDLRTTTENNTFFEWTQYIRCDKYGNWYASSRHYEEFWEITNNSHTTKTSSSTHVDEENSHRPTTHLNFWGMLQDFAADTLFKYYMSFSGMLQTVAEKIIWTFIDLLKSICLRFSSWLWLEPVWIYSLYIFPIYIPYTSPIDPVKGCLLIRFRRCGFLAS